MTSESRDSLADVAEAGRVLAELIAIPSPSGAEGEIAARVEGLAGEWGLEPWRVPTEIGRDNVVVGSRKPVLVFAAHLDTIPAPWPAEARIDGDVVSGLGAVDDKGGVVACLLAARELLAEGVDLESAGVAFAFSVDEERGGAGSRALALALRPQAAIALEATALRTAVAEVGGIEAVVEVRGSSGHGARRDLGVNAIDRAVELIASLRSLGLEHNRHPLLGSSSVSLGAIEAGTGHNTVPDVCRLHMEVDLVPGQDAAAMLELVERTVIAGGGRLELIEVTEAFEVPDDAPVVAALDEASAGLEGARGHVGFPAWTDAHNFWTFAGAQAVVFGPGDFDVAHAPDERIDLREVLACARVFQRVVRRGWRDAGR